MPYIAKEIMQKKGIPEDIIGQFDFPNRASKGAKLSEEIIAVINQMDRLLPLEQRLSIMEDTGCCTQGKPAAAHRAFGRRHAGKSIEEKVRLYGEAGKADLRTPHKPPCRLNLDGTLSVFWSFGEEGDYRCVCGHIHDLPQPAEVSPTFCGCCGGHSRKLLQRSLGVKLRLKEIVSSAASSKGKKGCEFTFDIVN